jgi:hypothetical protein
MECRRWLSHHRKEAAVCILACDLLLYARARARARERSFKPASPLCFDLFKDLVQKLKD